MSIPTLAPNSQLNIQGVQSSNISGTPIISSFPTTNTSNSLGHYHFVDDTTKASTHLNVSATSSGGHIFSHASSTQAPLTVLKIDRTALTLDTILRNSTVKTYLDMSLGELNLINDTYTNLITQGFMSMNDLVNNYTGAYTSEQVNLVNNTTNFQTRVYAGQTQISNNTTDLNDGTPTYLQISNLPLKNVKSRLTKDNLTITDISNNVSVLSPTDLTFNGVSVFSNIDVLAQKQVVPQMIVSSPAIYADSSIAPQPSPFLASYGFGGWAYKKASPQASNAKINWYLPFPVIGGTVGDLYGLYYQIFNNCLATGDLPFYTVYTRPLGDGSDYAPWYHSSRTYAPTANSSANQTCQMFMNIKSLSFTPNSIGIQNQINMAEVITNGVYLDTDVILFIAFGTNSGSALNSVDFSCSKIGMITNNFSAEYNLL
jgi:hypothetical protein